MNAELKKLRNVVSIFKILMKILAPVNVKLKNTSNVKTSVRLTANAIAVIPKPRIVQENNSSTLPLVHARTNRENKSVLAFEIRSLLVSEKTF